MDTQDNLLILKGCQVLSLLQGKERELMNVVRSAYEAHLRGQSTLPHSTFLRFPDNSSDRIIALPAYLGDGFDVCGVKWIASFPRNLDAGLDRASAVLIQSSPRTGRPEAIMEGSIISAKRTAASAALAAKYLQPEGSQTTTVGVIGCGLINLEIVRFLLAALPEIKSLIVFDINADRAALFKDKCQSTFARIEMDIVGDIESVLRAAPLVSLATTATAPYISDLSMCAPGSTLLHVSLRDIAPQAILSCDNIVDDADHVCRAQTSVHLAEQLVGNRSFIRCALAEISLGLCPARKDKDGIAVFSPFGLGVLDIALGKLVYTLALEKNLGTVIDGFLPDPWTR
jgi:ornithine cyclodeaminase